VAAVTIHRVSLFIDMRLRTPQQRGDNQITGSKLVFVTAELHLPLAVCAPCCGVCPPLFPTHLAPVSRAAVVLA